MADNQGDQNWRSQSFRQNVRGKIEEAIRQSGNPTTKSAVEMENHVFQKARTKEEYLGYVARLIIHVREMTLCGHFIIIVSCAKHKAYSKTCMKEFDVRRIEESALKSHIKEVAKKCRKR